jgi:hypothetical protein
MIARANRFGQHSDQPNSGVRFRSAWCAAVSSYRSSPRIEVNLAIGTQHASNILASRGDPLIFVSMAMTEPASEKLDADGYPTDFVPN